MTPAEVIIFLCMLVIVGAIVVIILAWQFYKEAHSVETAK